MSAQAVFPVLRYHDAQRAIDFLERAFGFERRSISEEAGIVRHAELEHGGGLVMLASVQEGPYGEFAPAPGSAATYVVVEDVDDHHEIAVGEGAEVVIEPSDQEDGSRDYSARDPEGNLWSFGTYDPWDA